MFFSLQSKYCHKVIQRSHDRYRFPTSPPESLLKEGEALSIIGGLSGCAVGSFSILAHFLKSSKSESIARSNLRFSMVSGSTAILGAFLLGKAANQLNGLVKVSDDERLKYLFFTLKIHERINMTIPAKLDESLIPPKPTAQEAGLYWAKLGAGAGAVIGLAHPTSAYTTASLVRNVTLNGIRGGLFLGCIGFVGSSFLNKINESGDPSLAREWEYARKGRTPRSL